MKVIIAVVLALLVIVGEWILIAGALFLGWQNVVLAIWPTLPVITLKQWVVISMLVRLVGLLIHPKRNPKE